LSRAWNTLAGFSVSERSDGCLFDLDQISRWLAPAVNFLAEMHKTDFCPAV